MSFTCHVNVFCSFLFFVIFHHNKKIISLKKMEKQCPSDKIWNPETNRCVLKTGKIGKKLLLAQEQRKRKESKEKCATNKLKKTNNSRICKRSSSKQEKINNNLLDITSWENEKPKKKGSNPSKIFYSPNGEKYYGKIYKNYERIETEHLASVLYLFAGIDAVETRIAKNKKDFVLLQKWIDNLRLPKPKDSKDVRKGFLIDVWLANWDAPMNDNIMMKNNNEPIRIDVGGSLDYRARGGKKDSTKNPFGAEARQLFSMRKKGRHVNFKDITNEELREQKKHLEKLSNDGLYRIIFSIVKNQERAQYLFDTLVSRKEYLLTH